MQIKLIKKARYISSVTILYGVTLLLLWQGLTPLISQFSTEPKVYAQTEKPKVVYIVQKTPEKKVLSGIPIHITVPKLALDKEVLPGIYNPDTQTWEISWLGLHYAELSKPANDSAGNTLIYAHNNHLTFGRLNIIQPGDNVEIVTDNGLRFSYVFKSAADFDPHDTSLFTSNGPPTLILQTCSGYFNEYRRMYSFSLQSVEKI